MAAHPNSLRLGGHGEEDVGGGLPVGAAAPVEVLDLLVRLHPSPRRRLRAGLRRDRGRGRGLGIDRGTALAGGGGEEAAEGRDREPAARPQRRKHRFEPCGGPARPRELRGVARGAFFFFIFKKIKNIYLF